MSKTILVFGATGEIGGRIARLCADAGHRTLGVSRGRNTRPMVDLKGVEPICGDKRDEAFLADVARRHSCDVIIDSVPQAGDAPRYRKHFHETGNFMFCGSTGKFVPLQYLPADEDHPWRDDTGVNFYHQSRIDMEILDLWSRHQFPATIFCPTNIIGEHRVPLDLWGGRNPDFFRLLRRNAPITIAPCEDIPVQSGYNWDLASAFVAGIDHPEAIRGETFIISSKKAVPLGRYLATAMDFLGSKSEIEHAAPERIPTIHPGVRLKNALEFLLQPMCFDIGKAERVIGYRPTHSTLEGLVRALEWSVANDLF